MTDKELIEYVAKAIYKSSKSYIGSMKDCEKAARHVIKALKRIESSDNG